MVGALKISIIIILKPVLGIGDGICVLKNRKRLVIYLILSPHTPALFTMSLIQTAGHKMRVLTIMFTQLPIQMPVSNKEDKKLTSEKLRSHNFKSFLSIVPVIFYVNCFGRTVLYTCIEYHI